ncbi:MAG: hypothetical protein NTY96_00370 [Bacteroidetes bacterium]|nr:hypothetical protein [Bacteroidota bacterium]
MTEFAVRVHFDQKPISREILSEVLPMILDRGEHIHKQLAKGIAIETELALLEEETKDLNGAEIYVIPWFRESNELTRPNAFKHSLS